MEPIFILAFDHRTSLQRDLFGTAGEPSSEQAATMAQAKRLIFEGFTSSLEQGVSQRSAAILIDERFGSDVAIRARELGITFAVAVEKSGQKVFEFEYGSDFREHIDRLDPTYCKALLRYNPEGDADLNRIQANRLGALSKWLEAREPKLMVELLVPAEPGQLETAGRDGRRYDRELRPALMRGAIEELQSAGVKADVWKIEGLDRREDCEAVAALTGSGGHDEVGCVVLGRGADDSTVESWLRQAAPVRGYAGFAVGRTIWWRAVEGYLNGQLERDEAVEDISRRYRHFIDVYRSA